MKKVRFNGKEYTLLADPERAGTHDKPFYKALAKDDDGTRYEVTWNILENYLELNDFDNAEKNFENWDVYSVEKTD
jgi:hypothetical protein